MSLFAVIPAAGLSRRMGQPKLVMPLAGRPVISRLLDALDHPQIAAVVVVARHSDEPLQQVIREHGSRVTLVLPDEDPPDMRASVEHAIEHIHSAFTPSKSDGWMLIPADHAVMDHSLVGQLIRCWSESATDVMIPTFEDRRGHPAIMRWSLASRVSEIPKSAGLNELKRLPGVSVEEVAVSTDIVLLDLDTPADLAALEERYQSPRR